MKDCTTCKYGFVDEQLGFPMCHHPSRFSKDCVDFNMYKEKEEPKNAIGIEEKELHEELDEAAGAYLDNHKPLTRYNWGDLMDAFKAGAEWDRAKMLEKAVEADVMLTLHDKTGDVSLHTGYLPKELGIKCNDKVKIIIVKEDEK